MTRRLAWVLLGLSAACGSPQPAALPSAAPASAPPSATSSAAAALPPPPSVELETDDGGGGTMHYADRLVIRWSGSSPLELSSDEEAGRLVPLFNRVLPTREGRIVLLGWSSFGGGEDTQEAWIVESKNGELAIVDKLSATGPRAQWPHLVVKTAADREIRIARADNPRVWFEVQGGRFQRVR